MTLAVSFISGLALLVLLLIVRDVLRGNND